jgi:hypothetical protein
MSANIRVTCDGWIVVKFDSEVFKKIYQEKSNLVNIGQKWGTFYENFSVF